MRAALAMCALAVGAASTPSVALALPVEFTMPPRATKAVCEPAPITSALPDLGATGAHRQRPRRRLGQLLGPPVGLWRGGVEWMLNYGSGSEMRRT